MQLFDGKKDTIKLKSKVILSTVHECRKIPVWYELFNFRKSINFLSLNVRNIDYLLNLAADWLNIKENKKTKLNIALCN